MSGRQGKFHWNLLLFAAGILLYITVNFQRSAAPGTIFSELQQSFHASATEITQIGALFMIVYAAVQLLVGALVDRFGGARVIAVGGSLIAAGSLLFPLCSTLFQVYCCRIAVGIGCGSIFLSMVKEIDRLFPKRFPAFMGILYIFGFMGTIAGTLPLAWIVGLTGWRIPFFAAGLLTLTGVAAYWYFMRKVPIPKIRHEKMNLPQMFRSFRLASTRNLIISCSLLSALYYVMIAMIGKKVLEDCGGFTSGGAAGVLMAMAVASAVSSYAVGRICTNFTSRRIPVYQGVILTGLAGYLLGFLAILLKSGGTVFYVAGMILIACSSSYGPVATALMRELMPPREVGMTVGTNNFSNYVVIAVFGALTGVLMDFISGDDVIRTETAVIYSRGSYMTLFLLLALTAAAAWFLSSKIPETNGRNISTSLQK